MRQVYPVESYDEKAKLLMDYMKAKKSKKKQKKALKAPKPPSDKQQEENQRKLEAAQHLQAIVAQGTELSDGPIVQRAATVVLPTNDVPAPTVTAARVRPAAVAGPDGVFRATVATDSGAALRGPPGTVATGSGAVLPGAPAVASMGLEADMPVEFMAQFDSVHRTLYGRPALDGVSMGVAQREVDRMCAEIGVPPTAGASYQAISDGLARAAKAVGC